MVMKKLCLIVTLLLSISIGTIGCGNKAQVYGLVSDQKGKYSLAVVGDDQIDNKLENANLMKSIFRIETNSNYDDAKESMPFLKIEDNKPNYFVFDTKDLKYQTTSFEKLVEYIKDNPDPK
ncbi:hypothetical protein WMZ97_04380 [Lentibacillus sp. N15]